MYFGFSDEQEALREAVAAILEKRAGVALLQTAWTDPAGPPLWAVWADLADMGVQGLLAPEAAGGSGLDHLTMAAVLAETGRAALPLPVLETAAVAVPVLAAAGDPLGLLPAVAQGSAVVTVGAGRDSLCPSSSRADWFLLGGVLYGRPEVELEPVPSVDRTRDTARVVPKASGIRLGGPVGVLGALAAAAQLVGLGRALVAMTVDYVTDRKQFGVPVGSFQAVKHHLADAALQVEFAAPAVWGAAHLLDAGSPENPEVANAVSMAKALASDAATLAARKALQCHGAMGYTDDYHLHFWLKRVWCLAASYGTAGQHRALIGRHLGLSG